MAIFSDHSAFSRLPNGNAILRSASNGARNQYASEQLRLFSQFDFALRGNRVSGPGLIVPAGYAEFRELWAQDTACRYQFVEYDPASGAIDMVGVHLPVDFLAPVADDLDGAEARVQANDRSTPSTALSRHEARRQTIVDTLILDQLERGQRVQETIRERRERRERESSNTRGPYPNKHKGKPDHAARPRTQPVGASIQLEGATKVAGAGAPRVGGNTSKALVAALAKGKDMAMDVDKVPFAGPSSSSSTAAPVSTTDAPPAPAIAKKVAPKKALPKKDLPKKTSSSSSKDDELIDFED